MILENKKINNLQNWDYLYKSNKHMSLWPWDKVISLTNKYVCKKKITILEIGCGYGANIPFLLTKSNNYYGIDFSATAIKFLKKKYPKLKKKLVKYNFVKNIPFKEKFDLIIDRGSLVHNKKTDIIKFLRILNNKMKKNSIYIGCHWFTNKTDIDKKKSFSIDKFTKTNLTGIFDKIGYVHFSTEEHIKSLFKNYKILLLEENITNQINPKTKLKTVAFWNLVAQKKN